MTARQFRPPAVRPYGRRLLVAGAVLALAAGPAAVPPVPGRAPVPGGAAAPASGAAVGVPGGAAAPASGAAAALPGGWTGWTGSAPTPGPSPTAGPTGADGAQLYLRSCGSCHGERGQGTQRGPSLVGVGPASVDFQVSTGRMPLSEVKQQPMHKEPVFSAEEIRALVQHVATFGGGGPQIPRVAPGDVISGRELYIANCAACHSAGGAGGALTNGWIAPSLDRASPTQIAEAIRVGPGLMPAFPGAVLTDRQVDDLVAYVEELQGGRLDQGGASLGRFGPFPEGLIGWGVGLLVLVLFARVMGRRAGQ